MSCGGSGGCGGGFTTGGGSYSRKTRSTAGDNHGTEVGALGWIGLLLLFFGGFIIATNADAASIFQAPPPSSPVQSQ